MTRQTYSIVMRALAMYQGDNLERAEHAFKGMSAAQMAEKLGESGKTRQQVLDGYRQHRAEVNTARAELETL